MYAADMPADQISQALAVCAAANYLIFDGTKQGLGLALLCALACPASEVRAAPPAGACSGAARWLVAAKSYPRSSRRAEPPR